MALLRLFQYGNGFLKSLTTVDAAKRDGLADGRYGLVEVKLGGDKLIKEGVDALNLLTEKIDPEKMKMPSFKMILIGVGTYAYRREDGIYVVPIGCLKD